jgi:hypothetical protein
MKKVKVILGEEACSVYHETRNLDTVSDYIQHRDGYIRELEFNTEQEYNAYIEGINDGNMYDGFWVLDNWE